MGIQWVDRVLRAATSQSDPKGYGAPTGVDLRNMTSIEGKLSTRTLPCLTYAQSFVVVLRYVQNTNFVVLI